MLAPATINSRSGGAPGMHEHAQHVQRQQKGLVRCLSCRRQAYTCWNQASSARVNNWGTRIDLILLADTQLLSDDQQGFAEQWMAADIEPERQGSDHAPAWADLDPLQPLSLAATPPALSSRFLFPGAAAGSR